ncbi:hypothetical protein SAMN04489841_0630 [Natrinema salaciae]|uniref:Uncharacterized protein n=1 Tax=Natrinema salaciae TaxID=1186196 RepID=A0A1H9B596_9EURY|nr:hypothetical protein SAMN04489841_0630 [Natrinema salaciae]
MSSSTRAVDSTRRRTSTSGANRPQLVRLWDDPSYRLAVRGGCSPIFWSGRHRSASSVDSYVYRKRDVSWARLENRLGRAWWRRAATIATRSPGGRSGSSRSRHGDSGRTPRRPQTRRHTVRVRPNSRPGSEPTGRPSTSEANAVLSTVTAWWSVVTWWSVARSIRDADRSAARRDSSAAPRLLVCPATGFAVGSGVRLAVGLPVVQSGRDRTAAGSDDAGVWTGRRQPGDGSTAGRTGEQRRRVPVSLSLSLSASRPAATHRDHGSRSAGASRLIASGGSAVVRDVYIPVE